MNDSSQMSAEKIAALLGLEGHVEGGFFRRTYESSPSGKVATEGGERFLMTSIFYLLTHQSPTGRWHLNKSDIMHYYHLGDPIEYSLIHPDGRLEKMIMGNDIVHGEKLQLMVPGGVWKTSRLLNLRYGFGLISEAVSPGFEYADMTLGDSESLSKKFPQHKELFKVL